MSAHTPGPWRIETFKGDDLKRTAIVACNGDGPVAVASFPDEGDYAANARLIAAAPDLYEALNAAFHAKIIYVGGGPEESIAECGIGGDLEIVRQLISAALTKACGS